MKKKKLFMITGVVAVLLGGVATTGYMGYRQLNKMFPDMRAVMELYKDVPENSGLLEKIGIYYRERDYIKKISPLYDLHQITSTTDTEFLKSAIDSLLAPPLYVPDRTIWRVFLTCGFIRWEELDTMGCISYIVILHKTLPPAQFDEFRTSINSILPFGAKKYPEEILAYYSLNQVEADKAFSINSTRMYSYLCQFLAEKNPEKAWELIQSSPAEEHPYLVSRFILGVQESKALEYLDKLDLKKMFGVRQEIPEYHLPPGIDYTSFEIIENPVEEALVSFFSHSDEKKQIIGSKIRTGIFCWSSCRQYCLRYTNAIPTRSRSRKIMTMAA